MEYSSDTEICGESNVWSTAQTQRYVVREMCGVQLRHRDKCMHLVFMLCLNETIDQLIMTNCVHWYGHVLRREDGHVLRRALDYEVDGQRKKGRPKRTWKKQVEEEIVKVGLRMEDALCRSKWIVDVSKIAAGLR